MNTQTKIAGALLLVLTAALSTTATLGYFIYERTLAGLVSSRFEFIAEELKGKIETGLDLGLPLGELETMTELLRQEILTDDALVGLTIKNAKGVILFDTDSSRIGVKAPEPWLESLDEARPKSGSIRVSDSQLGLPLVNSFDKVVGGLLVTHSESYYQNKRAATVREIGEITLIALLLSSFVGLCGVLTISRPLDSAVMRLEASLRTILLRAGLTAPGGSDGDLEAAIVAFERNVLDAVIALEHAEADVARAQPAKPSGG